MSPATVGVVDVSRTARRFARRADRRLQEGLQRSFERRLGVDTFGARGLSEYGIAREDRVYHVASPAVTLRRTLERLNPGPDQVLADIGSGKGQAVLVAAQLPYRRVIGVELADGLTAAARANVERARDRLTCTDVRLVTADALAWEIPEDLTVAYLYCPFLGDTFEAFVERLVESHDANPRPLHLVYAYPFEHNHLVRHDRFAVVDVNSTHWPRVPGWWDNDKTIVTYRLLEPGAPAPEPIERGYRQRKALELWSRPHDIRFELHPPDGEPIYSDAR
jgi:SAM-dependent methyltransferase